MDIKSSEDIREPSMALVLDDPIYTLNRIIAQGPKRLASKDFEEELAKLREQLTYLRLKKDTTADWVEFGIEKLIEWKSTSPHYTLGSSEKTQNLSEKRRPTAFSVVVSDEQLKWNIEIQQLFEKRKVMACIDSVIDRVINMWL
ncbi:hypothetical protein ACOME3_001816 [Neoechinorhynchus agilis]